MASYQGGRGQNAMSYQGGQNNNFMQYQNQQQQQFYNTYQNQNNAFNQQQNNSFPSNPPPQSDNDNDDDSDDWYNTDSEEDETEEYHRQSINIASLPIDTTTTNYVPQSQPNYNKNNNYLQQQQQPPGPPSYNNNSYNSQLQKMQQQSMSMRTVTMSRTIPNSHTPTTPNTMAQEPPKPHILQQMSQSTSSLYTNNNNNNNVPPPPSITNIQSQKKKEKKKKRKKDKKQKKNSKKRKNKDKQYKIQTDDVPPPPPPTTNLHEAKSVPTDKKDRLFKATHVKTLSIAPPPGLPRPPAYSYASTIASDDDDDKNQQKEPEIPSGVTRREHAVSELISTEITYVGQLEKLIKLYADKLVDKEKIINDKDHNIVFPSSLNTILNLNKKLLDDLTERKSNNHDDKQLVISDILLGFTPYFKMYQSYINNSQKQLATITKCLDNQKFYNFQQQTRKNCNRLTLSDMVILPIQRIPRYKLLVQEIFKRTDKNHPDFEGLQQALDLIEKINEENNEKLKDLDSRIKVLNITNEIEKAPNLSSPTRKFIFSGELFKIKTNGKLEKMIFYLFNDCMIYCGMPSAFGKKYIFKMRITIDAAFAVQKIKDTKKYKNVIAIYSSLESFMVTTRNNTELKFKWMKILTKCIDNARHGHYYHTSSRNARMGRGSVFISQASLQIPKQLKKELNKELSVIHMDQSLDSQKTSKNKKKGKHQRFKTKHQIALLTESDKLQVKPERGNTSNAEIAIYGGRERRKTSKVGMFSYSTGSGHAAEPDDDDLSDDDKELFGILPKSKQKQSNQLKVSQSVRALPGLGAVVNNNNNNNNNHSQTATGFNNGKGKRGTKPFMYAIRKKQNDKKGGHSPHERAVTEAIPTFAQIANNKNNNSHIKNNHIKNNNTNMGIPPPPPPTIPMSRTSRTESDPPPPPSVIPEATQQRLSVVRRRSIGGSISHKNSVSLNNNEIMKNLEYEQEEEEEDDDGQYDDNYDQKEDTLIAPKQLRAKSTNPSSFNKNKKKKDKKPSTFVPLNKEIKQNSAGAVEINKRASYGAVIWRNNNINDMDNRLIFQKMKNILPDVEQYADNQSTLNAVTAKSKQTDDILVVINSQNESIDHELIQMLRENLSFDQELLLFNNKQNGGIYRAPWLTDYSNIKFTKSEEEVMKHIKKFTKYAKLNSMMKSDEDDSDNDQVITKSNTFTPSLRSNNRQQTFNQNVEIKVPTPSINKTKSVNSLSSNVSISSNVSNVSRVASPKASDIAKTFTARNNNNNSYKPKSSGVNDALSVIRKTGRFNAFKDDESDNDEDNNNNNNSSQPKNTSAPFGRSQSTKITRNKSKKAKPYNGDPTIWNCYLDEHNNIEPSNEWALHKWVKANKEIKTISFKQAREMYKGCKGRGRL